MKKIIFLVYIFCFLSIFLPLTVEAHPPPIPFAVSEVDGSPETWNPTIIKFPNGTLSVSNNNVTYTPVGGSTDDQTLEEVLVQGNISSDAVYNIGTSTAAILALYSNEIFCDDSQWNVDGAKTIDGEKIADDTIDDDSIDFSDVTFPDFTGAITATALNGMVLVDGTTYSQDETGIEAAIGAVGANGTVFLSDGTYLLDGDGISISTNGITLIGGRGAIVKMDDDDASHNMFNISADYVRCEGFTIDGNKANQSGTTYYGLKILDGADWFVAKDLLIHDVYDRAINIQGDYAQITDCLLYDNGSDTGASSYRGAIVFQDANHCVASGNVIKNSPSGIVGLSDSVDIIVDGNTLDAIDFDQGGAIFTNDIDGWVITNNNMDNFPNVTNGVNGIFVTETNNSILTTIISANRIYGATGVGIELQDGNVICSDNYIKLSNGGAGTSGDQHGIYVAAGSDDVVIDNNIVDGSYRDGVFVGYDTGGIENLSITNNIIKNSTQSGINFDFASGTITDVIISNNHIIDNGDFGIEKTDAGTITDCVIYANHFANNTTGDIDTDFDVEIEGVQLPYGSGAVVDEAGEVAIDTATTYFANGQMVMYGAASKVYMVGVSNDPTDNYVPKYDAGTDTVNWEAEAGGAGATAYDDIGDPDASGSITMGAYTGTYTSATDGWGGMIISNTVADLASDTTLLTLDFADNADGNQFFFKCTDASGTRFEARNNGVYVGDEYAFGAGASQDARIWWETDGNDHLTIGATANSSATQSGVIVFGDAYNTVAVDTSAEYPILWIHSDDDTTVAEHGEIFHDGTDFNIKSDAGDIMLNPATGILNIVTSATAIYQEEQNNTELCFKDDNNTGGYTLSQLANINSAIHVYLSSNQNIDTATNTKVQFDAELYDDNNEYDNSSNYRWTCKEDGVYAIASCIRIDDLDDGDGYAIYVYKNGSSEAFNYTSCPANAFDVMISMAINLKLDVDDYIEIYAKHYEGATQVIEGGTGSDRVRCWLTIAKIGNR